MTKITKENYQAYTAINVVAFSYAFAGAMGEGGALYILSASKEMHHINTIKSGLTKEQIWEICPPLKHCEFGIFGKGKIPEGWSMYYLGMGNHFVIKDTYKKEVMPNIDNMEGFEIFLCWKTLICTD